MRVCMCTMSARVCLCAVCVCVCMCAVCVCVCDYVSVCVQFVPVCVMCANVCICECTCVRAAVRAGRGFFMRISEMQRLVCYTNRSIKSPKAPLPESIKTSYVPPSGLGMGRRKSSVCWIPVRWHH